jgi:signal transduction histidine kinase/ligand-binding sensor domain-containing protein
VSPRVTLRTAFRFVLACVLSVWSCAFALDPALDVSQYAHTAWKIRDGFARDSIYPIAQTPDGYLWLGTSFGLLRFDGVRTVPWRPPAGAALPDDRIRVLLAARDGTLWIGASGGLASWKDTKLVTYPRFDGNSVNAIAEDREGTVWVGVQSRGVGLLCAIRNGKSVCDGEDGSLGDAISNVLEVDDGALWVAGGSRLWRWKPGPPIVFSLPGRIGSLRALSQTASGEILVATTTGMWQVVDGKVQPFAPLPASLQGRLSAVFRDRDGANWIGTSDGGVFHIRAGRIDAFARGDGLSGDFVYTLFEDRERNVWVATVDGVDRFRAFAAPRYSVAQGLPGLVLSVIADRDGSMWLTTTAGLYRWHDGRVTAFRARGEDSSGRPRARGEQPSVVEEVVAPGLPDQAYGSLFLDTRGRIWLGSQSILGYFENGRFVPVPGVPDGYIDAIAEAKDGNLWIAHRGAGLLRLRADREVQQIPWAKLDQSGAAARLAVDPVDGGLWVGSASGGIVHLVDGRVRASYSIRDGLGKGEVRDIRVTADGAVWAATDGGLSRLKAGRIATLDRKSGLPCDAVLSTIDDDEGSTWLYTACGLARVAKSDLDAWSAAVDKGNAQPLLRPTVLDSFDGVRSVRSLGTFGPQAAKARDGKLWFAAADGVTVVDPRRLQFNKLPPPVHVEQIVADRKPYDATSQVKLPPLVRDVQIDYTALSLVAPEKNRFRYKLEGRDSDWQDAGNRRQAFYTDLDPGNYRFRVIAANNSGVWNEEGATLDFSVAPAYWQTGWFRALCVAALILLLLAAYRLRVRQLQRTFSMTLDARVNERLRIARELHDTLLQSFQSLLPSLQSVFHLLPSRPADAKAIVGSVIDEAAEAITEGRDAVQGLRASVMESNDLAEALRALGEELAAEKDAEHPPVLAVEVQGRSRPLRPIVRDEVFRVASEALRNAFAHAAATRIEVEVRSDERQFRLRVRDDGKGVDSTVLRDGGREGHFGMPAMRERAEVIRGKLTVWSAVGSGTEVELVVPAANAYDGSHSRTQTVPSNP